MAKPKVTKAARRRLNEELGFDTSNPAVVLWEAQKMTAQVERFLSRESANHSP